MTRCFVGQVANLQPIANRPARQPLDGIRQSGELIRQPPLGGADPLVRGRRPRRPPPADSAPQRASTGRVAVLITVRSLP
jgi:hypothetical protein